MFIDDVSLCTIFANLLDNAIEACEKIAKILKIIVTVHSVASSLRKSI